MCAVLAEQYARCSAHGATNHLSPRLATSGWVLLWFTCALLVGSLTGWCGVLCGFGLTEQVASRFGRCEQRSARWSESLVRWRATDQSLRKREKTAKTVVLRENESLMRSQVTDQSCGSEKSETSSGRGGRTPECRSRRRHEGRVATLRNWKAASHWLNVGASPRSRVQTRNVAPEKGTKIGIGTAEARRLPTCVFFFERERTLRRQKETVAASNES